MYITFSFEDVSWRPKTIFSEDISKVILHFFSSKLTKESKIFFGKHAFKENMENRFLSLGLNIFYFIYIQ